MRRIQRIKYIFTGKMTVVMRSGLIAGELVVVKDLATTGEQADKRDVLQGKKIRQKEKRW